LAKPQVETLKKSFAKVLDVAENDVWDVAPVHSGPNIYTMYVNVYSEDFDTQEKVKNALFYDNICTGLKNAIRDCGEDFALAEIEHLPCRGKFLFFFIFRFYYCRSWNHSGFKKNPTRGRIGPYRSSSLRFS
jgi:hypothetical protein